MICRVCQTDKPEAEFYLRKDTGRRRRDCAKCHAARGQLWADANRLKRRHIALSYYRRNKDKQRAWRRANPDKAKKWDREHPGLVTAMKEKWRKANPEKVLANVMARHAKKLSATPPWADMTEIKKIYAAANKLGMEVDHIVPLRSKIVCGLHVPANLAIVMRWVNRKKSNKYWPDMP